MIASDIITAARYELADSVSPYRWSDELLVSYLNKGIKEIRKYRADVRMNDEGDEDAGFTALTTVSDTVPIRDEFEEPLTDYLCFRCFKNDSDEKQDSQKAIYYEKEFMGKLGVS